MKTEIAEERDALKLVLRKRRGERVRTERQCGRGEHRLPGVDFHRTDDAVVVVEINRAEGRTVGGNASRECDR